MAKQLSAAYFPISAVGISAAVFDTLAAQAHRYGTFGHGFTYGGHPVGAALALEALAIYEEMDLLATVGRLGETLDALLAPIGEHPRVGQVRRVGLLAGVELLASGPGEATVAKRVAAAAEARGVFFRAIDNVIAIAPPYTIDDAELRELARVLRESLDTLPESTDVSV